MAKSHRVGIYIYIGMQFDSRSGFKRHVLLSSINGKEVWCSGTRLSELSKQGRLIYQ